MIRQRDGAIGVTGETGRRSAFGSSLVLKAVVLSIAISVSACSNDAGTAPRTTSSTTAVAPRADVKPVENFVTSPEYLSHDEMLARYLPNLRHPRYSDYMSAAKKASALGDYESAEALCNEALKLKSNDSEVYYQRGRARLYATKSQDEEAMADLKKAEELGFTRADAYELMARIYDNRSQPEKALEAMSKALQRAPTDKGLYKWRAALYVAHGDKKLALNDYAQWMHFAPDDVLPYVLRGQLLESMAEYEKALKDYAVASSMKENRDALSKKSLAFKLQALLLSRLNRHKEAIECYSRALDAEQGEDEFLKLRGDQYAFLKEYDKAIKDYNESIEEAGEHSKETLEARAKAYLALGKKDLAEKDLLEAKKLQEAPAEQPLYDPKNSNP